MSLNQRPVMDTVDSPQKRRKTENGFVHSGENTGYNSANDDGDDLFEGYIPDTPKVKGFETQPTQLVVKGFETQPTQVLPKIGGFETQPTQLVDRNAPTSSPLVGTPQSIIQVPASSPFSGREATPQKPTFIPQRNVASLMAPAGTAYKAPMGILKKPEPAKAQFHIDLGDSDSDDGPKYTGGDSDSDDGQMAKADIKPSTFKPRSAENSFGGTVNGNARFQEALKNKAYQPPQQGVARPQFGSRPGQLQMKPSRAMPIQDERVDDLDDARLRENITRIRIIFPSTSVLAAKNALIAKKGNLEDAIDLLSTPDITVISDDEDELAAQQVRQEPQMKRGLEAPTKSIRDKYSSTQAMPYKLPTHVTPVKPKRKLIQGRKNPSSPAISSPLKPQQAERSATTQDEEVVDLEDYETDDSALGEEEEEDPELEARLLKYLNACSIDELVELTAITKPNAQLMIDARPFKHLDAARCVESAPLKSGKKSTRAPIGDKIVDTAMNMFSGYEAIDVLVARCKELGKPLADEMATWGFNVFGASKDGELEMTSLEDDAESMRDSGIGSPTSGTTSPKINGEDDIRTATSTRKRSNVNFLKKPELMADDCILKDYQVVGLNWLALMYRKKTSGILADEMGLGKTCQVIAFLAHLVETGNSGPHLVVCPGSTLENWLRECQRFAPQLHVEPYHGAQKDRGEMADAILANRDSVNIVVTTYDMAQKKEDNKFMRRLRPDVSYANSSSFSRHNLTKYRSAYTMRVTTLRMSTRRGTRV
jgi:SWI/SNF-related matrix-associated actin-dependent regulator 1 of chromatin subfamily A